jgi:Uma2 family endonuclease
MVVKAPDAKAWETLADLHERLGFVPLHRIRLAPAPGTATVDDLQHAWNQSDARWELVDGTIVEKEHMGAKESLLAFQLGRVMGNHVSEQDLGIMLGADGQYRLAIDDVRIPDLSFIPWEHLPNEELPPEAICPVVPTLIVEVLSPSNRAGEMERRLSDYFKAGVKLAWVIDPVDRTARVYSSLKRFKLIDESGTLDGGRVLPGFRLPLAELFAANRRRRKK